MRELQAKMAHWDRIEAVASHLQDLVDRLNDEFKWDEFYQRTAEVRLATGGMKLPRFRGHFFNLRRSPICPTPSHPIQWRFVNK